MLPYMKESKRQFLDALFREILGHIILASNMATCALPFVTGLVYIVRISVDPDDVYYDLKKIGHTNRMGLRRVELEGKHNAQVFIEHTIWTDDPPYLESHLHRKFSYRRANVPIGTEWFRLTQLEMDWLKQLEAVDTHVMRNWMTDPRTLYDKGFLDPEWWHQTYGEYRTI